MKKLNKKEAVRCFSFAEFKMVILSLFPKADMERITACWKRRDVKDKCVSISKWDSADWGYGTMEYYKSKDFKILSHSEFMEEWKPKVGEMIWYIETYDGKFYLFHCPYKKCYSRDYVIYRTRQLARDAKKAIGNVLKNSRKG